MRLDEIRKDYDAENDTLEDLKKKLRNKLRDIHPDNNNGNYDKDYFKKINDDLEYVEKEISKENSKGEIKLSSNDLIEIIQKLNDIAVYANNDKENQLQKKFDESIQEQSVKLTKKFKIKRYSLAGITSLITFLWLLPDKILEHPILKQFFEGDMNSVFMSILSLVWGLLLLYTISYWMFTFKIENIEKGILENIKVESLQNEIFMNYINSNKDIKSFSKNDFMDHILWEITDNINDDIIRKRVNNSISQNVLQTIADVILKRAEEKKIIQKVEDHSLIEHFKLIKE